MFLKMKEVMAKRRNKFLTFLLMWIISGCATFLSPEQIIQKANTVNYTDGVNKNEAELIAQKYLIDNNLAMVHSIYKIEQVNYDPDGNFWTVHFGGIISSGVSQNRQFDFTQPITISVNGKNGHAEILK